MALLLHGMDQFLSEIEAFAEARGVMPTTVVQRAIKASGRTWERWKDRAASPSLETVDKLRAYMAANWPSDRPLIASLAPYRPAEEKGAA